MIPPEVIDAEVAEMAKEATEYAEANPLYTVQKVFEALESKPAEVSLAQALVAMLNNAYAVGYISAKRETKKRVILFPGYEAKN